MEIPEYLRASGWARFRGLLLGLAAILLVAATLYFFGGLRGWFGGDATQVAIAPPIGDAQAVGPPAPVDPTASAHAERTAIYSLDVGTDRGRGRPSPLGAVGDSCVLRIPMKLERRLHQSASPDAAIPEETPIESAPARAAPAANDLASATPAATPVAPTANVPAEIATPEATAPAELSVGPDGTVQVGGNVPMTVEGAATPAMPATGAAVEPEAPKIVELGTYRGGATVLLRYDDAADTWLRVAPRSAVVKGERLLALPEFRPIITLANGVHMDLLGGTVVALNRAEAADAESLRIDIEYGRIVLINTSTDERSVQLVLGPTSAEARLAHNATLAVEVERKYVPGNDPRKSPAPLVARMYVPDGGVVWQDAGGSTTIDKASEWTIADGVPTAMVASAAPPSWLDQEVGAQSSEQRFAAPVIDTGLVANRPIDVQLLELFQGNGRREVKSLVARSGMHVGLFVPFIEALRDSAQRPNWDAQIQSLRAAMAQSPESAERIRRTLVEQRGEAAAADLYEMLCGYNADQVGRTPEQVKAGAIARLIDWLDQDSLDYRVLAKYDLWEITGKQLMPNPAGSTSERKLNVRKWRSRLEAGDAGAGGGGSGISTTVAHRRAEQARPLSLPKPALGVDSAGKTPFVWRGL